MKIQAEDIPKVRDILIGRIGNPRCIRAIELVFDKKNIFGYVPEDKTHRFLKITVTTPKYMNILKDAIEKGIEFNGTLFIQLSFESGVTHPLRFMIDQ